MREIEAPPIVASSLKPTPKRQSGLWPGVFVGVVSIVAFIIVISFVHFALVVDPAAKANLANLRRQVSQPPTTGEPEIRSEFQRRRDLAVILYGSDYEGFDHQDLYVLHNAAGRGGQFVKRDRYYTYFWNLLSPIFRWGVQMTVSQVETGEPLGSLVSHCEHEWRIARRGYPEEVIQAGLDLLREPLGSEPAFGEPITIKRQAAGYDWEREIANVNDPQNGRPRWRVALKLYAVQ